MEPKPTYLQRVFSKYTRYDNKFARSSSVPCNNLNIDDVLKSKISDKNMASDSENVTELNLFQDSRTGVQKYSSGHYFDVCKDIYDNSSTGPLSCVSSTGDPMYDTAFAAGTQCHNMVRTKMT